MIELLLIDIYMFMYINDSTASISIFFTKMLSYIYSELDLDHRLDINYCFHIKIAMHVLVKVEEVEL